MRERVLHPEIYLKDRNHSIDLYVFLPCSMLWDKGIKTFYSCQGGPEIQKGKLGQRKAYVVVHRKDANKACKVLEKFNPKIDNNLLYKRVSIKFDANEAAKNIPVIIEQTNITYKIGDLSGRSQRTHRNRDGREDC